MAKLSKDQVSKHQEYTTKVINTIERLIKENPDSPKLKEAANAMSYYNTYEIPGNPFLTRKPVIVHNPKEVHNG
jgi:hypothetical protein